MALMSQRAYARHRAELGLPGTTHRAVQKAIEAGRIKLNAEGLIDSDAADRAWAANSSELHRRNTKQDEAAKAKSKSPSKAKGPPALKTPRAQAAPPPPALQSLPPPPPMLPAAPALPRGGPGEITVNEAAAAEKYWKAQLAELDFNERSGKLVPAEEVAARWVELITISKTKLLAVPAKAKARLPKLTAADVRVLDQLIREALEELGQGDDGEEGAADGH